MTEIVEPRLERVAKRGYVGKGLLALGLTILVPTFALIGALVLVLLDLFFGIAGLVVGIAFLLISFWWLWASRRGIV